MIKRLLAVFFLFCVGMSFASERVRIEYVYKVTKMSQTELGIACLNGGDPTGTKVGNTLIISCGR